MQDYTDLTLYIERAKANEEEAFVRIYEITHPLVYNIACVTLMDTEEAKDVVSEVFIRVFKHLNSLRDNQSFIRWLTVITHNVCSDHLQAREPTAELPAASSIFTPPCDDVEEWHRREGLQTTVQKVLQMLPEAQQRAVHYVYFNQLSLGQAAALENCSINTIKSRLYYARETLRRALEEEERRTGDKLHLSFATVYLASLMALPQVAFPLTAAESTRIFSTVVAALGIQYALSENAPHLIPLDAGAEEIDGPPRKKTLRTRISALVQRRYLLKFSPLFAAGTVLLLLCTALIALLLGGAWGRAALPVSDGIQATDTTAETDASVTTAAPEDDRFTADGVTYTYTAGEDGLTLLSITVEPGVSALKIPAEINGRAVVALDDGALGENSRISTLHLPGSLQTVSGRALCGLTELQWITTDEDAPRLRTINGVLYSADLSTLIAYPNERPGSTFTVPSDVRVIGAYAMNSRNLSQLTFPVSGIEIFEPYSLAGCIGVEALVVPKTTHTIGENAFACPSLTDIKVYAGNGNFYSVNGSLFNHEKTVLIRYPAGKMAESYTLFSSTVAIERYAFYGASYLTSIKMSNTVTTLAPYALAGIPRLTSITLSESIETLPAYCLADNPEIRQYTLPKALRTLDATAMADCENLTSIIFRSAPPELTGGDALTLAHPDCLIVPPAGDPAWSDTDKYDGQENGAVSDADP